jgi:hypothetical protein
LLRHPTMIPLRDDNPTTLTPIITVALTLAAALSARPGPSFYPVRPAVAAGELASIVDPEFLVYISSAQLGTDDGGAGSCGLFRPCKRFHRRHGIDPLL